MERECPDRAISRFPIRENGRLQQVQHGLTALAARVDGGGGDALLDAVEDAGEADEAGARVDRLELSQSPVKLNTPGA